VDGALDVVEVEDGKIHVTLDIKEYINSFKSDSS